VRSLITAIFTAAILSACGDATGPSGTITFRTDPVSCASIADIEITIDGESQGTYRFEPGAEWLFTVSPGNHSVQAQGQASEGGFVNVTRDVTVPEGGDFTVLLTCNA
jgi:hypothetical protein